MKGIFFKQISNPEFYQSGW